MEERTKEKTDEAISRGIFLKTAAVGLGAAALSLVKPQEAQATPGVFTDYLQVTRSDYSSTLLCLYQYAAGSAGQWLLASRYSPANLGFWNISKGNDVMTLWPNGNVGIGTGYSYAPTDRLEINGTVRITRAASGVLDVNIQQHRSLFLNITTTATAADPFRAISSIININPGANHWTQGIDSAIFVAVDNSEHTALEGFAYATAGASEGTGIWGGDFHAVRWPDATGACTMRGIEVGIHPERAGIKTTLGLPADYHSTGILVYTSPSVLGRQSYKAGSAIFIFGETSPTENGWNNFISCYGPSWAERFRVDGDGKVWLSNAFHMPNNTAFWIKDFSGIHRNMLYVNSVNELVIGTDLSAGKIKINIDGTLRILTRDANGFVKAL